MEDLHFEPQLLAGKLKPVLLLRAIQLHERDVLFLVQSGSVAVEIVHTVSNRNKN